MFRASTFGRMRPASRAARSQSSDISRLRAPSSMIDSGTRRPPYLELVVSVILLVVTAGLAAWAYVGNEAMRSALGVPLAILTGALTMFVTYFAQIPRFRVLSAGDTFEKKYRDYYLHLKVKNTSWGFLGGGSASNCRGTITIAGRDYAMKWANEPEPLITTGTTQVGELSYPSGLPQSWLIALAEVTEIPAGECAVIDVAMKSTGDSNCYIHEAKNYWARDHKANPLPEGRYPFILTLTCRGRPPSRFRFLLVNGMGTDPESLDIRQPDGRPL